MINRCRAGRPSNSCSGTRYVLIALLLAVTALPLVERASAETAQPEINDVEFNIPAQSVPAALKEFARQANVQIFFISDGFEKIQANAVIGTYAPQHALDLLLVGTGLAANLSPDAGVKVRPANGTVGTVARSDRLLTATGDAVASHFSLGEDKIKVDAPKRLRSSDRRQKNQPIRRAIDEIVVTGSNIRGMEAVGANVTTLDRTYIELSGIATTTELVQSIPQNFGLGNEAVEAVGLITSAGENFGFSSSVDLRGLGSDSTLMLLNGRRSAAGGGSGSFVDLNMIPTSAVQRIEVLPDGASAIYGSDAVGGVVNVILRDGYNGAETTLRYAPGTSDIEEIQISHVFGNSWERGQLLFGLEYYDRSALRSENRVYAKDSDLTPLGGANYSVPTSNPGNIVSPTTFQPAFGIPAGQDGSALEPNDLLDLSLTPDAINLQNYREGSDVLPQQERHSAFATVSQELSNKLELFAEARYSKRNFQFMNRTLGSAFLFIPTTNAFFVDAFGGSPYFLHYNFIDDYGPLRASGEVENLGAVLGAKVAIRNSWDLEVHGSYGAEQTSNRADRFPNSSLLQAALAASDPQFAVNLFGDGSHTNLATLSRIEGFVDFAVESTLSTANALFQGDLFDMPGGKSVLAVGAQYRRESLDSDTTDFLSTPEPVAGVPNFRFDLGRDIKAVFAELYLPLVSEQNSRPGARKVAASIAGRYEDYSDFGDTFDPKLGVSWSLVDGFTIRSTVGTSFRAPLLTELNTDNNNIIARNRTDPAAPSGTTLALTLGGNSPDLIPQEGTTWTVGFDIKPQSLPGFEIGVTNFATEVRNLIQLPLSIPSAVFSDSEANGPIIRRVDPINDPADLADVVALLQSPDFVDIGTGVPRPEDVGAIVDGRVQNIATAEVSGLDINLAYSVDTIAGLFDLSFHASHLFNFSEQLADGARIDKVDTIAKPNSMRIRSSVSWSLGSVNAAIVGNHVGDYLNTLGTAKCVARACPVASWTTWDVRAGYAFSETRTGFLGGLQVSLSVRNAFDNDPPFVEIGGDSAIAFDAINANPLGQFAALQLTKTWE